MGALWAPSVMLMDATQPFDPKGGLHEWVRGPCTEPARLLVASWGRGPVAGMEPGSMFQFLLGGGSQNKRERERRGMACSDQLDHSLRAPEGTWSAERSLRRLSLGFALIQGPKSTADHRWRRGGAQTMEQLTCSTLCCCLE